MTLAAAVAIIDEDNNEDGDAAHPSPSRISSAGNDEILLNPTTVISAVPELSVAASTTTGEEEQSVVHLGQEPPDIIQEQPLESAHCLPRRRRRVRRIRHPCHQEDEVVIKSRGCRKHCRRRCRVSVGSCCERLSSLVPSSLADMGVNDVDNDDDDDGGSG